MTENRKEIKSSPMGFLAASTFERSPNAHSVVCFCVCFHQDCFLEEIGLEPKALCFLKGVTTFPGPRNHGQGPWHKAQPCSSLGPEVQAGCQSEDHGRLHMRSSKEESVRGTRQQCEHGAGGTGQGGTDTGLGEGLNWRVVGGWRW